jgi:hypothetical protein
MTAALQMGSGFILGLFLYAIPLAIRRSKRSYRTHQHSALLLARFA